jgi:mRNA interferase MazF
LRNRPALVIQTDLLNAAGHPASIVIPGTTQIRRDKDYFPLRIALVNQPGLAADTDLLIDQVRAISNARVIGQRPLAKLTANHLKRAESALRLLTGL